MRMDGKMKSEYYFAKKNKYENLIFIKNMKI